MDRKDEDAPEVPKISRALPMMRWTEAFPDFLARIIDVRTVPLSYVIREAADVPAAVPALAANQPHSAEHGSVEADMVTRASHDHALFRDDNAPVYYFLEEATRSTTFGSAFFLFAVQFEVAFHHPCYVQ